MASSSSDNLPVVGTVGELMSVEAMKLADACLAQIRLPYVYTMEDVANGLAPMPPTFMEDVGNAVRGMFAHGVLSITGIHAVKISFLLFFHRLGRHITGYLVFWWLVTIVTVGSYAISMALLEHKCTLSPLNVIFFECNSKSEFLRQWRYMITYCTVDALSDVLILCLPVAILWQVRISMRKKLVLGVIFSLTLFTVAVTIIRATIQTGRVAEDGSQSQNLTWVWFWLSIEFISGRFLPCIPLYALYSPRNPVEYMQHISSPASSPSGFSSSTTRSPPKPAPRLPTATNKSSSPRLGLPTQNRPARTYSIPCLTHSTTGRARRITAAMLSY
ncbi:hypothetical protein C8A00DRAFT_15996 [Chaetomidium leptoderma]|uniref:Rhodopsin domain-containing protein n=1 Tax=Chaetomidium leptoderma TaxID=669021 RepID=A0AAN6VK42_9PEZI|nr:hypothetical protein C8A00DRAFT_15996 [Chaetomidium leptoderma]